MSHYYTTLDTKTRINLTFIDYKAEQIKTKGKSIDPYPAELSEINYTVILYIKNTKTCLIFLQKRNSQDVDHNDG